MYISEITLDTRLPSIESILTRYTLTLLVIMIAWFPSHITYNPIPIQTESIKKALTSPYDDYFHLAKTKYEETMLNKNGLTGLPPVPLHTQEMIIHEEALRTHIENLSYQIERMSPDLSPNLVREIASSIIQNTQGLSWPTPVDVLSIISIESNFDPNAYSDGGASGLMQIGANWRYKLPDDAFDSVQGNIKYGIYIMRLYYDMFNGDEKAAILSYNCGDGAYEKGQYAPSYWGKFLTARYKMTSI